MSEKNKMIWVRKSKLVLVQAEKDKAVLNSYCLVLTLVKFAEGVEKVENNSYKSVFPKRYVN